MSNFKARHSIFDIPSGFTLIELLVVEIIGRGQQDATDFVKL